MGVKFTKEHEWVRAEGVFAYVGISDFAQDSLGDIVFVELPRAGAVLAAGGAFGTVESVKAVSDLYAPVSGTIIEVNTGLEDAPELLNESPYDTWIIKLEIADAGELDQLMDADEYEEFCANEK